VGQHGVCACVLLLDEQSSQRMKCTGEKKDQRAILVSPSPSHRRKQATDVMSISGDTHLTTLELLTTIRSSVSVHAAMDRTRIIDSPSWRVWTRP
jgi:hypothetical protein